MTRFFRQLFYYLLAVGVVIGLWWGVAWLLKEIQNRGVIPTPWETFQAGVENIETLARAFGASALRFFIALVVAFILGLPLGLAVGFEPRLDRYLSPFIYFLYPIPPVSLVFFVYLVLGLGEVARLTVVVTALFFQVVVAAQGAAKYVVPSHVTAVRAAGATPWQVYRHVVLPATLPSVLTASKVSVGLGITMLYIAETKLGLRLGPQAGLGFFIQEYEMAVRIYLAGVVGLALLGLLFYVVLELLERVLCRWKFVGARGGT